MARTSRTTVIVHGLPPLLGERDEYPDTAPLDDSFWDWLQDERLDGLAWAAADAGELFITEEETDRLRGRCIDTLRRTLTCEAVCGEVVTVLSEARVESWVLKGIAVGHLDYPDPSWRNSHDTDILIRRADLAHAIRALESAGYARSEPGLAAWWESRFAKAVVFQSPEGAEVDLHVAFAVGYFGTRLHPSAALALQADAIDLGGVRAQGLAPAARLLFSCCAAVLGRGTKLRVLRDLAQQLLVTDCDWLQAVELARSADLEPVVARAFLTMADTLPIDPQHPALAWARLVTPSRRARRALELAERGEKVGWSADAKSTLLALGHGDQLRFLFGMAFPPAENRRSRGRSWGGHMRSALRMVRRPGRADS